MRWEARSAWRACKGVFSLVVAASLTACASIHETTTHTDTFTRNVESVGSPGAVRALRAVGQADGSDLVLTIRGSAKCERRVTRYVHRVETTTRQATDASPRAAGTPQAGTIGPVGVGLVLGGLGAFSYLDAENLAQRSTSTSSASSSPDTYRTMGLILFGGAAIAFGVAVVDLIRSRDTVTDLGEVPDGFTAAEVDCDDEPFASQRAALILPGTEKRFVTDADGKARVSMLDVPLATLSAAIAMEVGTEHGRSSVALPFEHRNALVAAVEADPNSLAAKELQKQRAAQCAERTRTASLFKLETAADEPAARRLWESAKASCGATWSTQAAAAYADFERASAHFAAQVKQQACEQAVARAQTVIDEDSAERAAEAIATVESDCGSRAAIPGLEVRLAAVTRRRQQEAAAEHKQACDQALTEARTTIENEDADLATAAIANVEAVCGNRAATPSLQAQLASVGKRRKQDEAEARQAERFIEALNTLRVQETANMASRDKSLCPALIRRDPAIASAVGSALDATANRVLVGGDASAAAMNALCLARTTFIACLGQARWREVIGTYASRRAATDPMASSKAVKTLNGGTCSTTGGTP